IYQVVGSLLTRSESAAFREPVDWRGLGLPDYPIVVKRPMDLGTVKRLLDQGRYRTPAECASDVRLIWQNCRAYNVEGGELNEATAALSERFEERYLKLTGHLKEGSKGEDDEPAPTDEERKMLAEQLRRSRTEVVSTVVHEVYHRCPCALEKVGDDIDVDVDALDTRTFRAVE
ncbi:unnamed protein product, partial [Choristocarpus tenellus]